MNKLSDRLTDTVTSRQAALVDRQRDSATEKKAER